MKINLLDTPGYLDFTGDAMAAVRVADAAVLVVGATSGVEVGTEVVWKYCEDRGIPRIFFVSMMDKEHADFDKVLGGYQGPPGHQRSSGGGPHRGGRRFPGHHQPLHRAGPCVQGWIRGRRVRRGGCSPRR